MKATSDSFLGRGKYTVPQKKMKRDSSRFLACKYQCIVAPLRLLQNAEEKSQD